MSQQLVDAVASSTGGAVTVLVTYPLEIVKNRLASAVVKESDADESGAMGVVRNIYNNGGILGFYDGMSVSIAKNMTEKFIYFYSYTFLRTRLQASLSPSLGVDLLAGSMADISHLPVTIPFETLLIKVVNNPQKGAMEIVKSVLAEKGISGLYAGIVPSMILSMKPAIQLAFFEWLKAKVLRNKNASTKAAAVALSAGAAFSFGALARAVATIIMFPYQRANFMFKNSPNKKKGNPFIGLHQALAEVVQKEGPQGLYNGLPQELVRAVISAALLMAVRERLTLAIQRAILRK